MIQIRECLPDTGFVLPTDAQVEALLKIVLAANPPIKSFAAQTSDFGNQFQRAFCGVGFAFRTGAPDKAHFFHWHLDRLNDLLRSKFDVLPVSGYALLAGVIAHNDVCYRLANPAAGQLLEIGVAWTFGRPLTTPNGWRGLLDGGNLVAPVAPRGLDHERSPYPVPIPRFFQNGRWGQ
jgi:hypothetical protein